MDTDNALLPVTYFRAPLTEKGFVYFVNITPKVKAPQGWICSECFQRVTWARQSKHVLRKHGQLRRNDV